MLNKVKQTMLIITLIRHNFSVKEILDIKHEKLPVTFFMRVMSVLNNEDREYVKNCGIELGRMKPTSIIDNVDNLIDWLDSQEIKGE